eukprot:10462986-Ditylum_brightwellii.AAC.1
MTLANMETGRITPRSTRGWEHSGQVNNLCQKLERYNGKGPQKTNLPETKESNDGILNVMGLI